MEVSDEVEVPIDLFCYIFPAYTEMELESLFLSWTFILSGNPSPCVGKLQIYESWNFSNVIFLIRVSVFSVMEVTKTKLGSIKFIFQKKIFKIILFNIIFNVDISVYYL